MQDKPISINGKRERREYYREWRKKNPGKAAEYQRRYWEKKFNTKNFEKASDEVNTEKTGD